jgi:hypothetical protein
MSMMFKGGWFRVILATFSRISQTMLEYSADMKEVLPIVVALLRTSESHIIPEIAFSVTGARGAGNSK